KPCPPLRSDLKALALSGPNRKNPKHQEGNMRVMHRKDNRDNQGETNETRSSSPRVGVCGTLAVIFTLIGWSGPATGQQAEPAKRAPDPTGQGEFAVVTSQYRLPATTDPTIMTDRVTELWARVWRPQTDELKQLPLVIFLHGNHGTCGTFFCSVANCGRLIPLPNGPRIDDRIDYTTTG